MEITAPAGYLLDSTPVDVEFTYEGQQIAWQIVDGTNTNLRTSVDISKQDITNGKELPGAKLEIRAADGNLVEGWTSGKVPHTVRGLELEKEYTLTEKRAPDGYAEAESIVFKLVQNGTEQVNEVYTFGTCDACEDDCLAAAVRKAYDLTPAGIIKQLNLTNPIYKCNTCGFRRGKGLRLCRKQRGYR